MALFDFLKKKLTTKSQPHLAGIEKYELPSFPSAVMNLLAKLRDPDSSVQELADEIEIDPGMHVRILKTVNSAAFGLKRRVDTVRHAVSLLGRSRLEALVLSVAVKKSVGRSASGVNIQQFWRTAALRAALSRRLADRLDPGRDAEAFAAGLLQDMGVAVLADAISDYAQIYNQWLQSEEADLTSMEQAAFETDHAFVGARMAQKWDLPTYLAQAIAGHHDGAKEAQAPVSVRVAALLKKEPDDEQAPIIAQQAHDRFGVETDFFLSALEAAKEDARELADALS